MTIGTGARGGQWGNRPTAKGWLAGVATLLALLALDAQAGWVPLYEGTTALTTSKGYQGATLSYSVKYELSGSEVAWLYEYEVGNFKRPGISHFTIELTKPFTGNIETAFKTEIGQFMPGRAGNSNPGLPSAGLYGVKLDDLPKGTTSFAVQSNHAPMWGDVYWKGGSSDYAYNTGFGTDPLMIQPTDWSAILTGTAAEARAAFAAFATAACGADCGKWVLTPDSVVVRLTGDPPMAVVPVPAALPILVAGLAGFACAGLRRLRAAA